jgi:hypothetical protein
MQGCMASLHGMAAWQDHMAGLESRLATQASMARLPNRPPWQVKAANGLARLPDNAV